MKKIILLFASLSFVVSCAQNKVNPAAKPTVETPTDTLPPDEAPRDQEPSEAEKQFKQLEMDVAFYKARYQMPDVFKKITDNKGNNFDDLYGTRNMREVLAGVYYRGGGNNKYHKTNPRGNENPLPADGLMNLCREGFSVSLFYYDKNFNTAKPTNPCNLRTTGEANTLDYRLLVAFNNKVSEDFRPFLQLVHNRIKGIVKGPIYGHCYNGWHASGMMAAVTLKQYCGFTSAQADSYWVKNTDGNSSGYDSVRNRIKNFVPLAGLEITAEERALICPM